VREAVLTADDGERIYSWGFTDDPTGPAKVPGPLIEVNEGDTVEITLINDRDPTVSALTPLGEGHTIHLHGLDTTTEHDGVPETFEGGLVRQGGSYTYRFVATHAGTYFYHCHQNNVEHQQMGMFGPIVVHADAGARTAFTGGPTFDRERVLVLADMQADGHEGARRAVQEADDPHNWLGYSPTHYLINDHLFGDPLAVGATVDARPGERVLVRAVNAGYSTHRLQAEGGRFSVIASDGRPWPAPPTTNQVWIGPGEKYDLLFTEGPAVLRDIVNERYPGPVLGAEQLPVPPPLPARGEPLRASLYVKEGVQRLPDGVEVPITGLTASPDAGAQAPGPVIAADEGQPVEITVFGAPSGQLNIVGLDLTMDEPVSVPGGGASYRFTAGRAGSYLYRVGTDPESPLFGALVVRADGQRAYRNGPAFDREATMVLSELDLPGAPYHPNYFLINGRAYPDTSTDPTATIHPQPGDRVLIRTINGGRLPHAMHLHGYHFTIVGREGRPWANGPLKDTVMVAPGEAYDLLFVADQAGMFPFHDHFEVANTNNGVWLGGMHTMVVTGAAYQAFCPLPDPGIAATEEPAQVAGPSVSIRDNFYAPSSLTVTVGSTVTWEHQGRVEHTVSSLLGFFDSGPLSGGSSFSFTFTQPGRYDYFCRFHITNRGVIIVT
jgi:manganese oxidase